jgi:hypothetical protein
VLLALIGPRWLTMTRPDARPLLADPGDWVRREIAIALARGRRVIPVLVANAPRLTSGDLPADLAPLADIEHRYLRRRDLDGDLRTIRDDLMTLVPGLRLRREDGSGPGIGVQVGENSGYVGGIRIGELRTRGGELSRLLGPVSVNVEHNEKDGEVLAADIAKWDQLEEWGNAGEKHPPLPEPPA